ncbi:MAG: acyl-CoA dehydrogenase family protein [Nitrosomonas sp.]|nr:acyl-CoA dehydrogenase family protein [Nitrosomonas sp.]MDP1951657.1 acyl-CoA dehydrogenase family protein [Nitrosomonas sp.]
MANYLDIVEKIATEVVAKNAAEVDRTGVFPQAAVNALRNTGLLGLISARHLGGMGEGSRAAALVVERLARECGSTAMVTCMHYAAAAVIEKYGSETARKQLAEGRQLGTLAFSETGSRSHFWAPVGTASRDRDGVHLNGKKSWVTSAHHATLYVWSSQPVGATGASTIWLVPKNSSGISIAGSFDGLGLRGNDSTPVTAQNVVVPESSLLGKDGDGLAIMLNTVLPIFNVMTAATGIGLMEGATAAACDHAAAIRHEHLDSALRDLPTIRAYLARMRITTDQTRCLWLDTLHAMETEREDMMLRVLECKAASGESATQVLDTAMRVCGGAAFRREVGVERRFRDARAGTVMAPTTDQLYDFIGKAICGLPIF